MDDANLLKDNGRKERAYTLFQLSSEETGKAMQILGFITFEDVNDPKSQKVFFKEFLNHKEKTKRSISMDLILLLVMKNVNIDRANFFNSTLEEYINVNKLNDLKNHSLYTSLHGGEFKTPKELISDSDLDRISFRAFTRYKVAEGVINIWWTHLDTLKAHLKDNPIDKSPEDMFEQFRKELDL